MKKDIVLAAVLTAASVLIHLPVSAAMGLAPKATPPSPTVKPDAKTRYWMLREDMAWEIGNTGEFIIVPAGFVTDFASIPQALWSLGLTPYDQYSRAAIIHDWLYWTQVCTKAQSDRLLVIAMKESAVGTFDEFAVYKGVQVGGAKAWSGNAAEMVAGFPRIAPPGKRDLPPNGQWESYRAVLHRQGVRDPKLAANPPFCRYGDSTDVPRVAGRPLAPEPAFQVIRQARPAAERLDR